MIENSVQKIAINSLKLEQLKYFETKKRTSPTSLSASFEDFISREINITSGIRSRASQSQQALRKFLNNRQNYDETFPLILNNADTDFIGGSYDRHTKNWPLDDIDLYIPLDGSCLHYYNPSGIVLPYEVLSDHKNQNNPLLMDPNRWMDGQYISSSKIIDQFTETLSTRYPSKSTKIQPAGQAVNIQTQQDSTKDGGGLGFDVVPCFSLAPTSPDEPSFYLIPDGQNGWIRTNPKIDKIISDDLQRNSGKNFRKAVKVVKYWNKEKFESKLRSYYMELAIMRAFSDNRELLDLPLPTMIGMAMLSVFEAIDQGDQSSWIKEAPKVIVGELSQADRINLATIKIQVIRATELYISGNEEAAANLWLGILGEQFLT